MLNALIVIRQCLSRSLIKQLLKNYTKIWEKVSNLVGIKFDSEPIYDDNDIYMKAKIKIYKDKVNTNFQGKKVLKENSSCKCFSLIILDSVVKVSKKSIILKCS